MAEKQTRLVDFHSHYYDPSWMPAQPPSGFSAAFAQAQAMLTDIDAQLVAMDAAGMDMRVLSAPLSTLVGPGEEPPVALSARINNRFAALVAEHPTRLLALAAIDPFGGDTAAREVERAITTLRLGGICLDCARRAISRCAGMPPCAGSRRVPRRAGLRPSSQPGGLHSAPRAARTRWYPDGARDGGSRKRAVTRS